VNTQTAIDRGRALLNGSEPGITRISGTIKPAHFISQNDMDELFSKDFKQFRIEKGDEVFLFVVDRPYQKPEPL